MVFLKTLSVTADTEHSEPYEMENNLRQFFGDNPEVVLELIDTFLDHSNYPYTRKELAEVNDYHEDTVYKHFPNLVKHDVVKVEKEEAGTKFYTLNASSNDSDKCSECGQRIYAEGRPVEDEIIEHLVKLSDAIRRARQEKGLKPKLDIDED